MVSGAPWSPEEVAQLTELLAAGHSRGECVRIMGRPLGGVRGTMLRHRLTSTARGGDPATLARRANDDAKRNSAANPAPRAASSSGPGLYSGGPGASPGRGAVAEQADVARGAQQTDPRKDPALHAPTAPAGYHLRGVSTLLDSAGVPVQTWVKTAQDPSAGRLDALFDAIKSLPDSFREAHRPKHGPEHADSDLCCVYPIGDVHAGMFAWREETGADYDLHIAEQLHVSAIRSLVEVAPPAKQALIVSLGDFFHCDDNRARTARHGNALDTDGRWAKVLRVGVRAFRAMIDAALEKHETVRVIVEIGNHDDQSAIMLALAMDAFYERDERVTVDTSPDPFHWFRFGKCLLGVTHGDGPKPAELPGIMAATKAADWGATKYRYWYTGHVHHESVIERPGCVVESFRTLAPRDAWAHRAGYRADRDMRVDVLHREFGRVTRHIRGVEQVA